MNGGEGSGRPVHTGRTEALRTPAKVNLHLEVLRRRSDGYHEIETIYQAIQIFDEVRVTLEERRPGGEPDIQVRTRPSGAAPDGPENLCWQAARLFCHEMRVSGRLVIELLKEIPAGAGLGGGSSDAAATLLACDRLFGTDLDARPLTRLAAKVGADVPFFLRGATALGRGTGTTLTPLPAIRSGRFLVVKPDFDLLTERVYAELKIGLTVRGPVANIQSASALIARFPTSSWFGFNRLEEVVLPGYPMLQRLVFSLREEAEIAMMCGSGSAVVAVFSDESRAGGEAEKLERLHPYVRVVGPHPGGAEFLSR
ncbi:MAG: 4-(cytidine 5'-diphospho)-2-C-methyl-D-erythritol kinase [Candidatus Krumholzibacteriia bacterium]